MHVLDLTCRHSVPGVNACPEGHSRQPGSSHTDTNRDMAANASKAIYLLDLQCPYDLVATMYAHIAFAQQLLCLCAQALCAAISLS